ncbi:MAG: hypothetical protein ABIJ20_04995 [Nanoarchaeota archaeon]|nr:hypothetical protein [Nanoarchaeota archaeon]MBU1445351.1 hypothetical protein [Nanoarchaeota archaeon]MBU2420371.1 hypothetical protein [Nanoarchaeota archaeon]MBU2475735.1 hypothetical protein [Nanoarchaeota archaeon]
MNKKGEEFLVNFFIIIVLTFLLFAYFVIFNQLSLKTGTTHDRELIAEYSTHGSLIFTNYLWEQVIVDGKEMEMNDLVALACVNESYIGELVLKTRNYMVLAQNAESLTNPASYNLKWLFSIECKNGEILFAESYLKMIGQGDLLETVHTIDKNGDLVAINKYNVLGTKVWFDDVQGIAATYGLVADTHPGLQEAWKQEHTYVSLSAKLSALNTPAGPTEEARNRVKAEDMLYIINGVPKDYLLLIISTYNENIWLGKIKITEDVKNDPGKYLYNYLSPKASDHLKLGTWKINHLYEMKIIAKNVYEHFREANPP